jgi:hypothetical protein
MGRLTKGGQPARSATGRAASILAKGNKERDMQKAYVPPVERIIAQTINETARGDPDALAARIVAALGEAGYRIAPENGKEDTALGSQPGKYRMEQLYRSPNGDTWFLARDPATGLGSVRHQANASSGGQVTETKSAIS